MMQQLDIQNGATHLLVFVVAYVFVQLLGGSARDWLRTRPAVPVISTPWVSVTLSGLLAFGICVGLTLLHIPHPAVHDEFSYLLAAETFAQGRVTNPTHPMWMHFETFYVLHEPTYASMYPPGQGLLLALGILATGHAIGGVCLGIGVAAAATCWMLHGWLPRRWALLGGVMTACHAGMQTVWGHSYWGGSLAMIGGALVFGAWPRLLNASRVRYLLLLAGGALILAISRPFEGVIVCLPVAVSVLLWLARQRDPNLALRVLASALAVLAVGGVAIGSYNAKITGNAFQLPAQAWSDQYSPNPNFLWQEARTTPSYRHESMRLGMVDESEWNTQQSIAGIVVIKLRQYSYLWRLLCGPFLTLPLLFLPWILRKHSLRWVAFILAGLFLASSTVPWLLPHYWAAVYCLILLLALQGLRHWHAATHRRRDTRYGRLPTATVVAFFIAAATTTAIHAFEIAKESTEWVAPRVKIENQLQQRDGRHLVLVRYGADHIPHQEWVHNGADIDASPVIWAHDMGESANLPLLEYFEGRRVWLVEPDRDPSHLRPY